MTRQRICLSMIVKDEAPVIERCLESVQPLITDWRVVDTGSTDETPALVRTALAATPGRLLHSDWSDFGTNRTAALEAARESGADYALVIDADDTLEVEDPELSTLTAPAYYLRIHDVTLEYSRLQLFRLDLPWRYVGVLHEYPDCGGAAMPPPGGYPRLEGVIYRRLHDGARHGDRKATTLRDIDILRKGLAADPGNSRYSFYLAQTLHEAGQTTEALGWYVRRIAMGGWDEEVFYSRLQAGSIMAFDQSTVEAGLQLLEAASQQRPGRAEPHVVSARVLNRAGRFEEAWSRASTAASLPVSTDALFVNHQAHSSLAHIEMAFSARGLGRNGEAAQYAMEVLRNASAARATRLRASTLLRSLGQSPGAADAGSGAGGGTPAGAAGVVRG